MQEKHPVLIVLLVLTFTLYMGYYAVQLQTDASFDSMYGPESNTIQLKNLVSNEFGSTETLFILAAIDETIDDDFRIDDVRHPKVLNSMRMLAQSIQKEQSVASVFSIAHALEQQYGYLPESLEESKIMIDDLVQDTSFFLSKDFTAANLIVAVDVPNKPGSIEHIETTVLERIGTAEIPVGVQMTLTGQPTLLNRIMHLLINDNLITIGIALLFVFAILWVFFRSPRIAIVAIQPVILTLIWLAGTLTLLDIRINMMTAAVGAMMVGMGIDYSIHMSHAFHENVKHARSNVMKRTVYSVGGALLASALTTIGGFIAMLFAVSPSSKIQGTVLAIGIAYAFLSTLIVLPCLLVIQRRIMYTPVHEVLFKLGHHEKKKKQKSWTHAFLSRLGSIQTKSPMLIIMGVLIFTAVVVPGATKLYVDTDNANWIPEGDPVIEAFNDIKSYFGGTEQLNLLVMADPNYPSSSDDPLLVNDMRHPEVLRSVALLDKSLEELEYISFVSSPTDDILAFNSQILPNELENVKNIIESRPFIAQRFNEDFSIIKLSAASDSFGKPGTNEQEVHYQEILNEIDTISFPEGIQVVPQGGIANFIELSANLSKDIGKTTLIGFLFVIIIASLMYRSFTVGMLSFIPIIFSILWAVGIMGYIGLPFTVLTSGMLAIVMGMGIDFSIHLVHNTKEWLKEGHSIEESVIHALTGTGEAIMVATVTTVVGFLSLALASLLVTRRLGFTLAIAIGMSFLACMLIVPAVLTIEHRIKNKKKINAFIGGAQK